MPGVFDTISQALQGHTTSGMDKAMQDHADKLHPVNPDTKIGKSNLDFPARPKVTRVPTYGRDE